MLLTPVLAVFLGAATAVPAAPLRDPFDQQATALYRRGEWDRLLALANARLADAPPADPKRADYLLARGEAYSELHDPRAAREALDRALPLAEAAGDTSLLARIHRHRGLVIWRYDRDLAAAEREYDLALGYARRADDSAEVVNILIVAANPYRNPATLDPARARRLYDEALAIARREHLDGSLPILLKNIGDVYRLQGDADRASATLLEAMRLADRGGATEPRWSARLALAQIARDRDPAAAERYLLESLDILDAKQSSVLLEDLRAGSLAGALLFADPYDEYIEFLMERGRAADAFLVAERKRARVFLDTLAAAREPLRQGLPAGFAAAEQRLLQRITLDQAQLRGGVADTRRAELVADVGRSEAALDDLRLRLAIERPALAHARYPRLATIASLQNGVLGADEALVSVYLGGRRSVAWIVTRAGLATLMLPARATLEPLVREALASLRDPGAADRGAVAALSAAVRADAIARLAARPRLAIVPDGSLHDVPFDALVDAAGRRLVERFATSYAPSASALAFLRAAPAPAAGDPTLVTVANPVVSAADRAAPRRPADLAHLDLLAPLPSSADETRRIARMFGAGASVLEGPRATRAELAQSGISRARIVHFATHGLIDEERPERSGLVLTADPPHDDGLLQVRQIYGLHLDAALVTLSACDTALGRNLTGEGMIGLTRAFFYAGARSVVASLWDVEDASTSRLMQLFYARLRAGEPIDEALQHAKLALLRAGGTDARPFYWASFVVSGQARAALPAALPWWRSRAAELTAVTAAALVATLLLVATIGRPRHAVIATP